MKPTTKQEPRDREIGRRIKDLGGDYGTRLSMEAHVRDIPVSVLVAVCEQESNFTNVFGHDKKANGSTSGIPKRWMGTEVTHSKYRWYKLGRSIRGNQGVGPMQLTNPGYQDEADADGGCWKPDVNIATAAQILQGLYVLGHGNWPIAFAIWNAGSLSEKGRVYAAEVEALRRKWHRDLT